MAWSKAGAAPPGGPDPGPDQNRLSVDDSTLTYAPLPNYPHDDI